MATDNESMSQQQGNKDFDSFQYQRQQMSVPVVGNETRYENNSAGFDQHRQFTAEIATSIHSAFANTAQQSVNQNATQFLLARLQGAGGYNSQQSSNGMILQHLGLREFPRPQPLATMGQKKDIGNQVELPNQLKAQDTKAAPQHETVAPRADSGSKNATSQALPSSIVPCRARGMPRDHNSSVSGRGHNPVHPYCFPLFANQASPLSLRPHILSFPTN
jgi:hypothetical protein